MNLRWLVRTALAALRGRGLGHGLAARPADRTEGAAVLAAVVLALLAVPLALIVAGAVHRHYLGVSAAERTTHHQVQATLLADSVTARAHDGGFATDPVPVSWRDRGGAQHRADAQVPAASTKGQTVSIWVDRQNQPVDAPLTPEQAFWRGVLAASAIIGGTGLLLTAALQLVHAGCDRRRHAAWGRAWANTEPLWSHRPRS
jgi:hypothetical protein